MKLENLKDKIVRNLPIILGVSTAVVVVTIVVVIKKSNVSVQDILNDDVIKVDLSNIAAIKKMIDNAADVSMIQVPEGSIIFVSE